ncbi:MAG: GspE/PulE family protein [Oscillospiraceae bacterium]|nr:GspE/PulE family protein [Oscillospiraceae bacterium]
MASIRNTSLPEELLRRGLITENQLAEALAQQDKSKLSATDYLVDEGILTAEAVARVQGQRIGVEYISLRAVSLTPDLVDLVTGPILRKHSVVPIGYEDDARSFLRLAMADPLNMEALDDIAIITGLQIEPCISTMGEINALLDRYYGTDEAMSAAEQYTRERESKFAQAEQKAEKEEADLNSAPIVQLIRSTIEQAVRKRASDIHIDALEKQVSVRFRIDGSLVKVMSYDINLLPAMVTRVKIMGGMDISEKRKAQDGRITVTVDRVEYDIRVSVLPTSYGEKVVMRLANTIALTRTKRELGMRDWELERFDHILQNPNGIILVTGPTGSGKSTTLYTALSSLNDESINIITVEDPVEANIAGINQVQVNPKADLTFASALRAILRQDPDIIMIGEIRDYETASIAVQASITGHLVVSTLHTNSSAATVTRLLDMGVESYMLADSVVGIIAQRLVRVLCPHCKKPRPATDEEKRLLGVTAEETPTIYEAVGCPMCSGTGFFGRTGVYEIMEITPELKRLITARSSTEEIKKAGLRQGMHTLRMSAARHVLEGTTTIHEMLKVSFED